MVGRRRSFIDIDDLSNERSASNSFCAKFWNLVPFMISNARLSNVQNSLHAFVMDK